MSFVERQDYDLVQTLIDMNTTIFRDFKYVSGSTTMATTPYDVYVQRRGVCQDFANLLICMARLLSVPARYRVGYIYTGSDYDNQVQSDASPCVGRAVPAVVRVAGLRPDERLPGQHGPRAGGEWPQLR